MELRALQSSYFRRQLQATEFYGLGPHLMKIQEKIKGKINVEFVLGGGKWNQRKSKFVSIE